MIVGIGWHLPVPQPVPEHGIPPCSRGKSLILQDTSVVIADAFVCVVVQRSRKPSVEFDGARFVVDEDELGINFFRGRAKVACDFTEARGSMTPSTETSTRPPRHSRDSVVGASLKSSMTLMAIR